MTEEEPEVSVTVTVFSQEELAKMTLNFDESQKIACGGQAVIFKGLLHQTEVAVKRFTASSPNGPHAILTELDVMKKCVFGFIFLFSFVSFFPSLAVIDILVGTSTSTSCPWWATPTCTVSTRAWCTRL